jgi:S-adenosylmethionine synthetase
MPYLFSSESVSEGHPDKVSDQISDALLDQFLAYDENSHCAIETFCTTGQVVIMGEVRSKEYIDSNKKPLKYVGVRIKFCTPIFLLYKYKMSSFSLIFNEITVTLHPKSF